MTTRVLSYLLSLTSLTHFGAETFFVDLGVVFSMDYCGFFDVFVEHILPGLTGVLKGSP